MNKLHTDFDIITSGCVLVVPEDELKKKLENGKKLRIKLGADPTAPDLHLGHTIVLSKLKQLQDLGHEIIFLIGDFTARIGDPTGKTKTRMPLTLEQIQDNTKSYFDQVGKVIDVSRATIRYNSEWLSTLSPVDIIALLSKVTVSRVIERDDFQKRLQNNMPISMHELLYPLFQAYDSVVLDADVEIGGTDQTFNMLMGRFLQAQYNKEQQIVLTLPILEGLSGTEKMSKSLGNAVSLGLSAKDAYAKIMSISDTLMFHYAELLLFYTSKDISDLQIRIANETLHPMELKKDIAFLIVKKFWSEKEAKDALDSFVSLVQNKDFTHAKTVQIKNVLPDGIWIVDLLKQLNAITSSSDARRLISQGAISINGVIITDFSHKIMDNNTCMQLRVGKHRFFNVMLI